MGVLRIRLFGGIQLARRDDTTIPLQPTVQIFLAYLLLHRQRYHCREVLSGLFWGEREESQARRCLSTTLWRLRQDIEPEGIPQGTFVVTNNSGEIGFNARSDQYWLDVASFEEKVGEGLGCSTAEMGPIEVQRLEEAADLYTGDLLEGFYNDWILHHRERLRGQYIKCLGRLMRYHHHRGAFEEGIYYGRKILAIDPLREEIHREVMRLYEQNGERPQAIQQYENCRQILANELEIQPMPETQALYQQLISTNGRTTAAMLNEAGDGEPENLQQALRQLDQALNNLEEVRGQLHRARKVVTQFLGR